MSIQSDRPEVGASTDSRKCRPARKVGDRFVGRSEVLRNFCFGCGRYLAGDFHDFLRWDFVIFLVGNFCQGVVAARVWVNDFASCDLCRRDPVGIDLGV
jgi:hypothetical protein